MMISVFKFNEGAKLPFRKHSTDGGADLHALESVYIEKGQKVKIRTGIAIDIPPNYIGNIFDRSSMADRGFAVTGGIIDCGYSGEISVMLTNLTAEDGHIQAGDRIAQIVIYKVNTTGFGFVKDLWNSIRGNKGFGSSGR